MGQAQDRKHRHLTPGSRVFSQEQKSHSRFATLKKLSERFVDFLILLAVEMGTNRNYVHYVEWRNTKIDEASLSCMR
jgi:hypothetical protein